MIVITLCDELYKAEVGHAISRESNVTDVWRK